MQKRILFLGASFSQIPPIIYAKEQGHYVVTCDYLPDNPGHQYADESYNVSTTDKEKVLKLAKELRIDGIVAYASDPAAPTQAYVGNKLNLPSNPYESVEILTKKDLFRKFLQKHGFYSPKSKSFSDIDDAIEWFKEIKQPMILKPIDSSGSKGVIKISNIKELKIAFNNALQFSKEKKIILEEFFVREGYQASGDGFIVDGKLAFYCWGNEHFDNECNALAPIGESFPSLMTNDMVVKAVSETQRLLSLLKMDMGALNFDFHFDKSGTFSFIELGPRNGGNLLPQAIKYATGVDLVKYTVDAALGLDCSSLTLSEPRGFYATYTIHSNKNGILADIWYDETIKTLIIYQEIYIRAGECVNVYSGSHETVGRVILHFSGQEEMITKMENMQNYIQVITKEE